MTRFMSGGMYNLNTVLSLQLCVVDVDCRELLGQNAENIRRLMQLTVANELSPTRSPNNMLLLTVVFQQSPDLAAKVPFPPNLYI